jgi:CheY-like chemotaxis protein
MLPTLQTILLVDDDETTNFLHRRLLSRLNVAKKITVATNGEEALQFLQNNCQPPFDNQNCPMLIFLDIKMPVMDGFEFLEEYENLAPALNPEIRIVMLSSSGNPVDLERLKSFSREYKYYFKPLSSDIIKEVMADNFA